VRHRDHRRRRGQVPIALPFPSPSLHHARERRFPLAPTPEHFASQPFDHSKIPWVPLGPGESFKPLRFLGKNRGRALLLRLEPGTVVPRHRHLGEVHGFNLQGERELIESGEIVGPGGYVYEPPGNVDSWRAVGIEPVIVYIIAFGAMEYLDESGNVLRQDDPQALRHRYVEFCHANGVEPLQLGES